jgi:hypothetical protein
MPDHQNFFKQWNGIISAVDKTDVPMECISKVILKLHHNRKKTINIERLRKQGLDYDDIETILKKIIAEFGPIIKDLEFILDIQAVADMVQPQTDKLLNGL